MAVSPADLFNLIRLSVVDPMQAAAGVAGLPLGRLARWQVVALVSVLSVLAMELTERMLPMGGDGVSMVFLLGGPLIAAVSMAVSILGMALALLWVGRIIGGVGRFDTALLLVVWVQVVLFVLQMVQLIALILLPPLALLLGFLGFGLAVWMLVKFVQYLHGFDTWIKAAGVLVFSLIGLAFGLTLILGIAGVAPPAGV